MSASVERWVDDGRGARWSTAPFGRMSKKLSRLYRRLHLQIHTRLGLLGMLAHRSAALLPQPPHQSISIESVVAGVRADIWLPAYSADIQRVLDENENRWVDPLDCLVFLQAWKCGAQWAHCTQDKRLQEQNEGSRSITSADTIGASPAPVLRIHFASEWRRFSHLASQFCIGQSLP